MPIFYYTAKKQDAETVTGQIFAGDKNEAVEKINQLGLLPVKVDDKLDTRIAKKIKARRISAKELYSFSKQLSSLLKAGIPLLRSLQIIQKQMTNAYFSQVVNGLGVSVNDGRTFSDSLADYPGIFPPLYSSMVRAGEESGSLKEMLLSVAEYYRKQAEVNAKVRSALVYPSIMLLLGVITIVFMMVVVMPKITTLFESMDAALPTITLIVLKLSAFIQVGWLGILIVVLTLAIVFTRWLKSKAGRRAVSEMVLKTPVLSTFILKVEMARFAKTMELLLTSGITIINALELAIPLVKNDVLQVSLKECQKELTSGGSFGESLKAKKVAPDMLGDLIAVGEESGTLAEALGDIGTAYQEDTEENIKVMTTLLEPIMIVVIGAAVAFIVFAILMPIFQMDVFA